MAHPLQTARERRGWSQSQLARLTGVSRQLIGSVESGVHSPRVDAALALAVALGTSVEQLFAVSDPGPAVALEADPPQVLPAGAPLLAARVGGRTVVTAAAPTQPWLAPFDAVATGTTTGTGAGTGIGVDWLPGADADAALIAGCDPCLGTVAAMLTARTGRHLTVAHASSARSAQWLRDGFVHAAVVHGRRGELPTWNTRTDPPVDRYTLTGWQVGLAGPPGRPAPDIARVCERKTRVVQRETGAGTQTAFLAAVSAVGADTAPAGPVATSHLDATARVVHGAAAAVTMQPAALAAGLRFTALAEHTVEIWVDRTHTDHPAVAAVLELLNDPAPHRRLAAIGGYDTAATGTRLTSAAAS